MPQNLDLPAHHLSQGGIPHLPRPVGQPEPWRETASLHLDAAHTGQSDLCVDLGRVPEFSCVRPRILKPGTPAPGRSGPSAMELECPSLPGSGCPPSSGGSASAGVTRSCQERPCCGAGDGFLSAQLPPLLLPGTSMVLPWQHSCVLLHLRSRSFLVKCWAGHTGLWVDWGPAEGWRSRWRAGRDPGNLASPAPICRVGI